MHQLHHDWYLNAARSCDEENAAAQHLPSPVFAAQTPEGVAADITPQEAAKYQTHFERAKAGGSWVELGQARDYFAKANLQVRVSGLAGCAVFMSS